MVSHEKNKITWDEYSTGPQTIILGLYIFLAVQDSTEWQYQNFDRNRYRDFFSETKFSETETLKKLAKVSKPRSFETEMSISDWQ